MDEAAALAAIKKEQAEQPPADDDYILSGPSGRYEMPRPPKERPQPVGAGADGLEGFFGTKFTIQRKPTQ